MPKKTVKIYQYNIGEKELQAFLGPLEANVIEILWSSKKPLTVREVYEKLRQERKIAYTTIMTTMDRLYDKGLLDRRAEKGRGGVFYIYWPKFEKNSFKKSVVHEVLNSLIENFGEIVASYFVERIPFDDQELKKKFERILSDQ
ncbi:MAG: BlaI/MecI/CopY family transcriptional regulator [Nitrososphaerota archaeon]|nr:BlaI/MecI/CopY family transcriptional regulator [Nitrososphaerota archaeon]